VETPVSICGGTLFRRGKGVGDGGAASASLLKGGNHRFWRKKGVSQNSGDGPKHP